MTVFSDGLRVPANAIGSFSINKDGGVHTKISLSVNRRATSFSRTITILRLLPLLLVSGCSYGVNAYIQILPWGKVAASEVFAQLAGEVNEWSEFQPLKRCEDNKYRLHTFEFTSGDRIGLGLHLNKSKGLVAITYGEIGVREFSPKAERVFWQLAERVTIRFGVENVIAKKSKDDRGEFVADLMGREHSYSLCK